MIEWSAADIPDLAGRIVVVTGANSGIGLETTRELAAAGATVIMACRSVERGRAARRLIVDQQRGGRGDEVGRRLSVLELDLTSWGSIAEFVTQVTTTFNADDASAADLEPDNEPDHEALASPSEIEPDDDPTHEAPEPDNDPVQADLDHDQADLDPRAAAGAGPAGPATPAQRRLDLLINNAGVMACPPSLTDEGIERQWATNHLGHFALTGHLLPWLDDGARVVSVSSLAAGGGDLSRPIMTNLDHYSRFQVYSDTKLANQVFAVELNHRMAAAGLTSISVAAHPGLSHTNLGAGIGLPGVTRVLLGLSRLMTQSAADGALPTLRAATDPAVEGGQYYGPSGRNQHRGPPRQIPLVNGASRRSLGRDLWNRSMELTGLRYLAGA